MGERIVPGVLWRHCYGGIGGGGNMCMYIICAVVSWLEPPTVLARVKHWGNGALALLGRSWLLAGCNGGGRRGLMVFGGGGGC